MNRLKSMLCLRSGYRTTVAFIKHFVNVANKPQVKTQQPFAARRISGIANPSLREKIHHHHGLAS